MAQSLSSIIIHLVFSTKHREPILTPRIQPELYRYLAAALRECDSRPILVGGEKDHIHSLFILSRKWTIAKLVEEIKTTSSKWIKSKGHEFSEFHWPSGYGAFSVSQSNVAQVRTYIANQPAHHRKYSFQHEFRGLLKKYEIRYEEKYLWD